MTADVYDGGFAHVPKGARCFALKSGSKLPATTHAHLDAVPVEKFAPLGNYGIALDGQFVLVDFDGDAPGRAEWEARLPPTWRQQTRRGVHWLYRVPAGFAGRNAKIAVTGPNRQQALIGDIKCNGYLVGPGSIVEDHVYAVLDAREPAPAPQWLLGLITPKPATDFRITVNGQEFDRERIELGRNDAELASIAGFLRHRGFGQQAIAQMLEGVIGSGILEQDPAREPYTAADANRIARSVANYQAGSPLDLSLSLRPDAWVCGADVPLVAPPVEWWIHGFVPKGQLVLFYGAGGIGKSSWGSLLAKIVTADGGTFARVGVEEGFRLFLARAALLGADRSKLFDIPGGATLSFPRDINAFAEALAIGKPSVVYFDSIYTHFDGLEGSNAAERARKSLGPLAELAQRTGITIVGAFHENKAGDWLGSAEMLNVPRSVLHATRESTQPLRIKVHKTNAPAGKPSYMLDYPGVETPWRDPGTGEVQMERLDDGTLAPVMLMLPGEAIKVEQATVTIDEINTARKESANEKQVEALRLREQGHTREEIASALGVSERTVTRYFS